MYASHQFEQAVNRSKNTLRCYISDRSHTAVIHQRSKPPIGWVIRPSAVESVKTVAEIPDWAIVQAKPRVPYTKSVNFEARQ